MTADSGSHAQRDLLTLTLIEVAMRANQRSRANHYLAERLVHKPTLWAQRLARRVGAGGEQSARIAA
jgi:hypothetical protein